MFSVFMIVLVIGLFFLEKYLGSRTGSKRARTNQPMRRVASPKKR